MYRSFRLSPRLVLLLAPLLAFLPATAAAQGFGPFGNGPIAPMPAGAFQPGFAVNNPWNGQFGAASLYNSLWMNYALMSALGPWSMYAPVVSQYTYYGSAWNMGLPYNPYQPIVEGNTMYGPLGPVNLETLFPTPGRLPQQPPPLFPDQQP